MPDDRARVHAVRLGAAKFANLTRLNQWTREQCATYLGLAVGTWTGYVSRGTAPSPVGWDPDTGRRVWSSAAVIAWDEQRPARRGRPRKP